MHCRVTDDPSFDASDYFEGKGYYAQKLEPNPDDARDIQLTISANRDPRTTPLSGDKHENY